MALDDADDLCEWQLKSHLGGLLLTLLQGTEVWRDLSGEPVPHLDVSEH